MKKIISIRLAINISITLLFFLAGFLAGPSQSQPIHECLQLQLKSGRNGVDACSGNWSGTGNGELQISDGWDMYTAPYYARLCYNIN